MNEIPKRRFVFAKQTGKVDLYLQGKKVVSGHRGETGNYYFRIPEEVEVEFAVAEHNPNLPVEAEVTVDGLCPIERKPKFVQQAESKVGVAAEIKAKELAEAQRISKAKVARETQLAALEAAKAKRDAAKAE